MKILTLLFSFYILLLSWIPCCAIDNCKDKIAQSHSNNKQGNNDDCKNCSPFSVCGNCVGFTNTSKVLRVEQKKQLSKEIYFDYIQFNFPKYISSFWQPPRLS